MKKTMRKWCWIPLLFCLFFRSQPLLAWERSSPAVPPDSDLYRCLDKLAAFNLIEPPIRGQRPYPRSEFARMTAEAMGAFDDDIGVPSNETLDDFVRERRRGGQIRATLDRLKSEFKDELIDMGAIEGEKKTYRIHPVKDFTLYGTYLDSPSTWLYGYNGRGFLNAIINPLRDYNLGRQATDGSQFANEFTGWFEAGRFFSGLVRPRFELNTFRSGDTRGMATVQNAYATFRVGNFSFKGGRESMLWGVGDHGSIVYSTNPRPLDGMWVTNPTPARLPWVFKHLGKWRYTLYGVNLGPGYVRKWAWIMGYKLSLTPAKYVELGFGHAAMIGGQGMPSPSALGVLEEFIGIRAAGSDPGSANYSNHIFEMELLVRVPELRGLEIYGNMSIDDKWNSIVKTLKHGCSYLGGIYLPAFNFSGSTDLRIEYVRTSSLQARHSWNQYGDGVTEDNKLIGTDAGPDADTIHMLLRRTVSPKLWLGLTLDWDYRRSDSYTETVYPNGSTGNIYKTGWGPREQRYRGIVDVDWRFKEAFRIHLAAGYERARNLGFVAGYDRNNWLAALALTWDFDQYFSYSSN